MRLGDIYGIPVEQEFPFATIKFSPINIDYWIRLERDYKRSLDDFSSISPDNPIQTLDVILAMLHCATYPYVQDEYTREAWADVLATYAVAYPVLIEWFLKYINDSLVDPSRKPKQGVKRPKS